MTDPQNFEIIIIGGSYSGLSAAMSLGRSLRKTLVIDSNNPCNKQTPHSHNFITQDGENPAVITRKAKAQVAQYPEVKFMDDKVIHITKIDSGFKIETQNNEVFTAKKIIFATGITDIIPDIPGFSECWGISILHCPYCHGYEFKEEVTGILGNGDVGFELSKLISNWSKNLTLFTNGTSTLTSEQTAKLLKHNIEIVEETIESIVQYEGQIQHLLMKDQRQYKVKALYARPKSHQQCELPEKLGCELTGQGLIKVDMFQKTTIDGIYAAGDNASPARSVAGAVAAGSITGASINKELINEVF